jgi:hypothetical protein
MRISTRTKPTPASQPKVARSRSGAALQIASGAVAASALVWFGVAYNATPSATAPSAPPHPAPAISQRPEIDPLTNGELGMALVTAGLSPKALAAAGLSESQVTALVGRARTHLTEHIQELRDADQALFSAQASHDALQRRIQSGQGNQADLTNFATAASDLASARTARQSVISDLITASVNGLAAEKTSALATLRANASWELPPQYLVVNHSESDWVALRDAVANDAISARNGNDPDPDAHTLLLQAQADPSVAASSASLQNLNALNLAWNQAVGGQ